MVSLLFALKLRVCDRVIVSNVWPISGFAVSSFIGAVLRLWGGRLREGITHGAGNLLLCPRVGF